VEKRCSIETPSKMGNTSSHGGAIKRLAAGILQVD